MLSERYQFRKSSKQELDALHWIFYVAELLWNAGSHFASVPKAIGFRWERRSPVLADGMNRKLPTLQVKPVPDLRGLPIGLAAMTGLFFSTGCADGLWYQMKKANPYYRAEWKRDEELGPTFVQRLDELQLLRKSLPAMDPADQATWAARLEHLIMNDASPEFRAQATSTVALVRGESTIRALNAASTDSSEKVRLSACKAWQQMGGPEARDMLLTLATKEGESTSIRQAAIEGLAGYDESEVREALVQLLDDRSPAIQYQVTRSLTAMTGQDLGGDMQAWRDLMSGKEVEESPKSLTATFLESIPLFR
jgi:hypothetical protein